MHLRAEGDSPQKCQCRGEAADAEGSDTTGREPTEMAAVQNRSIEQPYSERTKHLQARQRLSDQETAHKPDGVKGKTPPEQPRDGGKQIGQWREVIEN